MAMKAGIPGSLRRRLFRAADYTCNYCSVRGWEDKTPGGAFVFPTSTAGVHLSIDHIQARSRGGSNEPENLQVLCTRCNTRKGRS